MVGISHNANSSIQAGVATTVIDVCLAVGPSVASCTPACEGAQDNTILDVCVCVMERECESVHVRETIDMRYF